MSGLTLLLVLLSAITHAGWNLAGKKAGPSIGYFWLASLWGLLLGLPLVLPFTWPLLLALSPPIWAWLLLSGLFQALYIWGLAEAYRRGELSALYPLIRSSPLILLHLSTQVWQTHGRKKYGIFYLRVGLVRMINPLKSNAHNGDSPRSRISALALDGGLRLSRRSETSISAQSQANLR